MSSTKGKNTQLLLAGLVAAAALGLVLYYANAKSTSKESTKPSQKKLEDDDDSKPSTTTSTNSGSRSVDVTPRKSNLSVTDEKIMHTTIEQLDKKGKELFKKKQVQQEHHDFCE
jgi:uncharacterized protein HemX